MLTRLGAFIRHSWMDASDTRKLVPPGVSQKIAQQVARSEHQHMGEVRICLESALPRSYLWRHVRGVPLEQVVRQRALTLFGKLRVWDTERNNGVLIYLLLAERAIELVADRGLNQAISPEEWKSVVQRLSVSLEAGEFEKGLTHVLDEVSALLARHFPAAPGDVRSNELANEPVLL